MYTLVHDACFKQLLEYWLKNDSIGLHQEEHVWCKYKLKLRIEIKPFLIKQMSTYLDYLK